MAVSRSLFWLGAIVGMMAGISLATHRRREQERRALSAKPEPVQTWEGEGGAVPLRTGRTAQQVTPSNATDDLQTLRDDEDFQPIGGGPSYPQGRPH